jgi:hypothetical protein
MALDIRRAVRLDQALHGERFIRAEFLFAVLLLGALAVLAAVRLLDRHGLQGPGLVLTGVLLAFFVGGAVNYLALLWLARGTVVGVAPVRRDKLRSVTWRMVGLTLVPERRRWRRGGNVPPDLRRIHLPLLVTARPEEQPMQVKHANPVGTWKVSILAAPDAADLEGGPLQAGAAEALIVFQPDHTVLSLTPGPDGGTWQSGGPDAIAFEFRELIGYQPDGRFTGYAVVRQQGTLGIGGDAFSSSGQGDLYDADGTYLTTNHTTTQATRVS